MVHDKTEQSWLAVQQPRLGKAGMLALLVLTGIMPPLSTDIYTPAIPHMVEYLNTTQTMVTLTLVFYFVFFSIGMLIFGPISDRFGRRPVLMAGTALYLAASAACALTPGAEFLVFVRCFQGIGSGAMCSISMAIVKDAVRGEQMTRILSILQVMQVIGPVAAPLLGGFILIWGSWRAIFWALFVITAGVLLLTILFTESLPADKRVTTGIFHAFSGIGTVLKNPGFDMFLLIIALMGLPFMGYIAIGSYIYIETFGTTQQAYSMFFAACAAIGALGPAIYLRASHVLTPARFTTLILSICLATGVLYILVGHSNVWVFWLLSAIYSLAVSATRPYSTTILLSQNDRFAGAASSVINFTVTAFGCVAMIAIMPFSADFIRGLGIMMTATIALTLILWFYLRRSRFNLRELD